MNQSLTARAVFVTGANGGLGEQFVAQALERGARLVYAAARTPKQWNDDRIVPIALDVTDPAAVARAVELAGDVDFVVNNAGIAPAEDHSITTGSEDILGQIFATNFFGALRVAKAFAPVLKTNGGGTLLNVLSAASWLSVPTAYAASKAAMWSASNSLRVELQPQGTHVIGLHMGMVDTPMTARFDIPKTSAASVVEQAYDGAAAGIQEVIADELTRELKSRLGSTVEDLYGWAATLQLVPADS
ncbi:MAG: Short-chain dehydrogenase/reductase [Glaciihabitans sp.]|nr:Short-chain dehydrogenase/reductase [Glaciihabitans sp.]